MRDGGRDRTLTCDLACTRLGCRSAAIKQAQQVISVRDPGDVGQGRSAFGLKSIVKVLLS